MKVWVTLAFWLIALPVVAQVGPDSAIRESLKWKESNQVIADRLSTGLVVASVAYPCLMDRSWHCVKNEALHVLPAAGLAEVVKLVVHRKRPNGVDDKSFFSMHTAITCAAVIRTKAFALCPAVGYLRIAADWHWSTDVATGAAVGALLTTIQWGK